MFTNVKLGSFGLLTEQKPNQVTNENKSDMNSTGERTTGRQDKTWMKSECVHVVFTADKVSVTRSSTNLSCVLKARREIQPEEVTRCKQTAVVASQFSPVRVTARTFCCRRWRKTLYHHSIAS